MEHINLVLVRYDEPETILGVHHSDGLRPPTLITPDMLEKRFELGNKIEVTAQQLREGSEIPLEWKSSKVTDEWLLSRVTAYDKITPKNQPTY